MRRDFGGEVIAALVALAVIAFALTFGIIISLSNVGGEPVPTPLVVAVTSTPSLTLTRTPTLTLTVTFTPTLTFTPTSTSSAAPTRAAVVAITPVAEVINTDVPMATRTSTDRPSATPTITASSTFTPTATTTPTRTLSPTVTTSATPTLTVTLTATVTRTTTATPTLTATFTPTFTLTPMPTATRTSTPSATLTRTPTTTPSATFTLTLTFTLTPSATAALSSSNATCVRPAGWVDYVARGDEYMADIARAAELDLADLLAANCFAEGDNVRPYTRLYVPRALVAPIPTPAPLIDAPTLDREGCIAGVQIIAPAVGAVVDGGFTLVGTASLPAFTHYDIDIRPVSVDTFTRYMRAETPVIGGALAQIDADLFAPGVYWVRLSVYADDVPQTCAIPLIFR